MLPRHNRGSSDSIVSSGSLACRGLGVDDGVLDFPVAKDVNLLSQRDMNVSESRRLKKGCVEVN